MHKVCILVLKNVPKPCLSCAQTVPNLCTSCAKILSHSENRVQPIELHSERKGRTAIMSVLRFTKSRNTVWRPFYPLIRNNMTQNTVRDSRESPDKQENGILNRLAYLKKVLSMQLHCWYYANFIDVKKFPSRFLLPFLMERLVGTKYLFFSGGQICIQKKNLLVIWLIKWKRKNWLHADEFWSKIGTSHRLLYDQSLIC